jgi:hypothetical protein
LRKLIALGAVTLTSLAVPAPAHPALSQAARTIRVIISVPPGGSIDLLVRILADYKCGADFDAHIARQFDLYARLIRELNIKTE